MSQARRFGFRLALALGETDPDAMMARMPYRVFRAWLRYAELEPFGEERADLRAGIVASTIANCLARQKGRPAFRANQFMPKFEKERHHRRAARRPGPTPEEVFGQVSRLNQLFGGKVEVVREDGSSD